MNLREKDIQEVLQGVFEADLVYWDKPVGPNEVSCIFCNRFMAEPMKPISINEFPHFDFCIWNKAKDILFNEEKYKLDLL